MSASSMILAAALAAAGLPPSEPFRLPVGARVMSSSPDGRGWALTGKLSVTYVQARARLETAAAAAGWRKIHEIPLGRGNDRVLMSFAKGGRELTLMVSRAGVARSVFSCGVSARNGRGG